MAGRRGKFGVSLSPFGRGKIDLEAAYRVDTATEGTKDPPLPAPPPPKPEPTSSHDAPSPAPPKVGPTPRPSTTPRPAPRPRPRPVVKPKPKPVVRPVPKPKPKPAAGPVAKVMPRPRPTVRDTRLKGSKAGAIKKTAPKPPARLVRGNVPRERL